MLRAFFAVLCILALTAVMASPDDPPIEPTHAVPTPATPPPTVSDFPPTIPLVLTPPPTTPGPDLGDPPIKPPIARIYLSIIRSP